MTYDPKREARFVAAIERVVAERPGDRAALRRSLSSPPGADPSIHHVVYPWLDGVAENDEWRWFLIAGLMGLLPAGRSTPTEPMTLGASARLLKQLRDPPAPQEGGLSPTERRFTALLNADRFELPVHLRHFFRLMIGHDVPVDCVTLLAELRRWSSSYRPVQRQWARDFWRGESRNEQTPKEGEDGK